MGVFNTFGAVSGQMSAKQEQLQVANALVEELKMPGKLVEILSSFKASGQIALVREWISGKTTAVNGAVVQQALKQSTFLEDLAARTKMPLGVVKSGLAVLLPLAIGQLARDGYVTAEGDPSAEQLTDLGGLANALR